MKLLIIIISINNSNTVIVIIIIIMIVMFVIIIIIIVIITGVCEVSARYSRVHFFVSAPLLLRSVFDPVRAEVQRRAKLTPDLVMRRRATRSLLELWGCTWGCAWLSLALVTGVYFTNTCILLYYHIVQYKYISLYIICIYIYIYREREMYIYIYIYQYYIDEMPHHSIQEDGCMFLYSCSTCSFHASRCCLGTGLTGTKLNGYLVLQGNVHLRTA